MSCIRGHQLMVPIVQHITGRIERPTGDDINMDQPTRFFVWHNGERLIEFGSVDECKKFIHSHPEYKKSHYTKKGFASSKNPIQTAYFTINDNMGGAWYIK